MNHLCHESDQVVWLNGSFTPSHKAVISPLDRGLMYGDGLFETMRSENGRVFYFLDHMDRLAHSLKALRIPADLSFPWRDILSELLRQNDLLEGVASVKMIVTRGICAGLGMPSPGHPTICLSAQKYSPPPKERYESGWRLKIYRDGFAPPLAAHKTLNYLFFLMARQSAIDAGADEALVMDIEGNISEASAGSLIARKAGRWWTPASSFQLPGITLHNAMELLTKSGQRLEKNPTTPDELLSADTVWVLNSLIGIMPVSHIDGVQLPDPATHEASQLKHEIFRRG